jgi:hypothetical protein
MELLLGTAFTRNKKRILVQVRGMLPTRFG